jgi:two-component system sensor histidine kinase YesM
LIDNIQNTTPGLFSVVMPIVSNRANKENFGEEIGTCIIVCNNRSIETGMQDTLITKDAISAVLNSKSEILANYVGNTILVDKVKNGFSEGFSSVKILNKDYAVFNKKIDTGGWRIINITSKNELLQDFLQYRILSILVGLLSIIVVSYVIYLTIRNIYVPISEISKFLNNPSLNLRERIREITYSNEISNISKDINLMLDNHEEMTKRIFTQQEKLYEMELINKEAQLTNLFNQINPHFLYNTLENIRSLGIINKDDRIVEISTALASVLRYSIKSSTFVLLEDEIECVRNYMKIINIRYGGEIKLQIEIDNIIVKYKILKMVLQPIVENCIRHGFDESRNGIITITGKTLGDELFISVVDNGSGITSDRLDYVRKSLDNPDEKDSYLGIGLNNINKRIKLNFGDSFGLSIDAVPGAGTTVTVKIPLLK